jgi:hypothetical protein
MHRTVIVLIVTTVLLWGSAALGHRSPTTRLDGDPDEYQAKAIHNEIEHMPWNTHCNGGENRTCRFAPEPGASVGGSSIPAVLIPVATVPGQCQVWTIWLRLSGMVRPEGRGVLLREGLYPGKKQRSSGEGR